MSDIPQRTDLVSFRLGTPLERVEKVMILKTLELTNDDKKEAARLLGISVKTLQRKLRLYSNVPAAPTKTTLFLGVVG